MPPLRQITALALAASLSIPSSVSAITVQIDYTYDTSGFFTTYAVAKNALDQAASDIRAAITSSLGAITTDTYSGVNGGTTASLDWSLSFTNPTSGATETLNTFTAAANTVTIYAGARSLTGSTLGQGGPGSAGISLGGSGFSSEWVGAVSTLQTNSNAAMLRGGNAPTLGTLSGSSTLGGVSANYSFSYAPIIGNIWFDNDTNNDSGVDDAATLQAFWHFDHTTSVASGKNDFYSVALHEVLHAIGVGTSVSWTAAVSGTNWTGSNAIASNGTGTGLIDSGGAHIADDTNSTTISGGTSQEVLMGPSIVTGTRKQLTALDLAFLQDLGYSGSAVPEPAETGLVFSLLLATFAMIRRRARVS